MTYVNTIWAYIEELDHLRHKRRDCSAGHAERVRQLAERPGARAASPGILLKLDAKGTNIPEGSVVEVTAYSNRGGSATWINVRQHGVRGGVIVTAQPEELSIPTQVEIAEYLLSISG